VKEKILVVDDNSDLRELAQTILRMQNYEVILAKDGKEALEIFDRTSPDLVVSDIAMPKMDGFAFLRAVRSREKGNAVPFLFLSAYSQTGNLSQARRLAVDDYLFKPFDAQELLDAVRIRLDRRQAVQLFDTREAHLQTVLLMANIIEARDPYTRGHIDRVCNIALRFGKQLGWDEASLSVLEFGAILHDIGKLVVPTNILTKKGSFTPKEWEIVYKHPEKGVEMLNGIDHLKPAIPFILYHHERWNGSGYPFGLKGEEIPLAGRVLALADFYDAVSSDRPYHKGQSKEVTLKMIKENSHILFDPFLVSNFFEIADEL
jgi:putative two-component system response regulator